jgi:hypothetical protein
MKHKRRVATAVGTIAVRQVSGAAGADTVREQHAAVAVLARRGAEAERGDQ